MEKSKIKDQEIIKQQPNWVKEFLSTIKISQENENMPLGEMHASEISFINGVLNIEIMLLETEGFRKQDETFNQGEGNQDLHYERRQWLQLQFEDSEKINFQWQEEIYANSKAYDPIDIIDNLTRNRKNEANSRKSILDYGFKFHLEVKGTIDQQVLVQDDSIHLNLLNEASGFRHDLFYEQYPKALQHFIKEIVRWTNSWQKHFFNFKKEALWKPSVEGRKDIILRSSFQQYIEELYEEECIDEDLLEAPSLIYIQLLEYAELDDIKSHILKEALKAYYQAEKRWPKDLLEVIFIYYFNKFIKPAGEFEKTMLFIFMRYYKFSFHPEALSMEYLYNKVGEERPDLSLENLYFYDEGYEEWKDWVNTFDLVE